MPPKPETAAISSSVVRGLLAAERHGDVRRLVPAPVFSALLTVCRQPSRTPDQPVRQTADVPGGRMPRDVAHSIFDVYVRTGKVSVEQAGAWPAEVALVDELYGGDPVAWVLTAVCQDWDAMPTDVQDSLGSETYSEGSMVLRLADDGFDPFNRPLRPYDAGGG